MNSKQKEPIFIYGASGHAKVVIDIVEQQNIYDVLYLFDDNPELKGKDFFGYRVLGGMEDLIKKIDKPKRGIVAIGDNSMRKAVSTRLLSQGLGLASAVHPSANIGRGTTIGEGTVVMAGATINSGTEVGTGVVINTRASIDHDSVIGNFAHIAPGSTLCGGVHVGREVFLCAGATVVPNRNIGEKAIVAAGATVISDVVAEMKVAGVPAREMI